jgi:5-methylcytosine-specific restriction endonuclease McrA
MPIKPENKGRYPKDWKQIRSCILERAKHACEQCGVPNHAWRDNNTGLHTFDPMLAESLALVDKHSVTYIVLTVAHLNHQPEDCRPENLKAMCQRCHLRYDHQHHMTNAAATRRKGKAAAELF